MHNKRHSPIFAAVCMRRAFSRGSSVLNRRNRALSLSLCGQVYCRYTCIYAMHIYVYILTLCSIKPRVQQWPIKRARALVISAFRLSSLTKVSVVASLALLLFFIRPRSLYALVASSHAKPAERRVYDNNNNNNNNAEERGEKSRAFYICVETRELYSPTIFAVAGERGKEREGEHRRGDDV